MQISVDNNARPHNQQIINSPLTSLQHTPVPHVEKSPHACRKASDHLHAVKSVIDYSVRETHISNLHRPQSFRKPTEIWPDLPKVCLVRSETWRNTVVKLTGLARIRHYYSSLQIRTKNRCCLSILNNRHQPRHHGNADALEKCSLPQLKHIILERLHCWFNHSLYNHFSAFIFKLHVMSKPRVWAVTCSSHVHRRDFRPNRGCPDKI